MECNCHQYEEKFLDIHTVLDKIENAVKKKEPFSLTRFSHAEITYMNWDVDPVMVKLMEGFRAYNGVKKPIDGKVAERIKQSMKSTTLAGLISKKKVEITTAPRDKTNGHQWYPKTNLALHHMDFMPKDICSVWVTQEMIFEERFWKMLKDNSVVLVGRRAQEAAPIFKDKGVHVTNTVNLEGIDQVDEVLSYLKNKKWDIAIIAAGIPATLLTPALAKETGKVAIDFGHALDRVIDGDSFNFDHLVDKVKKERKRRKKRKKKRKNE